MSGAMVPLSPLHGYEPAKRALLPVSQTMDPTGAVLVVSRYGDCAWDFWPYIEAEGLQPYKKRVDWRVRLPDGSLLTDPQHAELLASAKDFIWSLSVDPVQGRVRPSPMTLRRKQGVLRHLLRWMVGHGIRRFSQLEGRTLDYVAAARREAEKRQASKSGVAERLLIVEDLHRQARKLRDAPREHPWPGDSAGGLAGVDRKGGRRPKTLLIPEPTAKALVAAALDYVESKAERLLAARDAQDAAVAAAAARGTTSASRRIGIRTEVAREHGFAGTAELADELLRLRTSCYIVVDFFSGIRISEVLSLGAGCISHAPSRDGTYELTRLHGTIYKTGKRPHKWIVPPVVETAVRVMERYSEPLRQAIEAEMGVLTGRLERTTDEDERFRLVRRLHTVRGHAGKLFLTRRSRTYEIAVLSANALNLDLKAFCQDLGILGPDRAPWPLHAHQFRRTFARYIAQSEMGDLRSLQEHFGHWSIDMTVHYTEVSDDSFEVDADLMGEIVAAKERHQYETVSRVLNADGPVANGWQWVHELRNLVKTAKDKAAFIQGLAQTFVLTGTGHSWCVGEATGTGCRGLCVYEPQMCTDCRCGLITTEHLPVWREIARQQREVLHLPDMGIPAKARAQEVLEKAERVVAILEGQEEAAQ